MSIFGRGETVVESGRILNKIDSIRCNRSRTCNIWRAVRGSVKRSVTALFKIDKVPIQQTGGCATRLLDLSEFHRSIGKLLKKRIQ